MLETMGAVATVGAAGVVALACGAVGAWLSLRFGARAAAPADVRAAADLAALCGTLAGTGDRLLDGERELKRLADRLAALEARLPDEAPFRQAIALAERGASRDELVADLGLAPAEAELVRLLHPQRPRRRAPAVDRRLSF